MIYFTLVTNVTVSNMLWTISDETSKLIACTRMNTKHISWIPLWLLSYEGCMFVQSIHLSKLKPTNPIETIPEFLTNSTEDLHAFYHRIHHQ